jgi:D-threo-aldose 1-dehydrogenase
MSEIKDTGGRSESVLTTTLPRRRIGHTGLMATELGLGAAALGNLYAPMSDANALATVRTALHAGVLHVDTAPYYGFGLSERRVGEALVATSGVVISSKVGRLLRPVASETVPSSRYGFYSSLPFEPYFDYTYDGVMRSWEATVARMAVARINILYVHDIGRATHGVNHREYFDQLTSGGGLRALHSLRSSGAIDAFGIGVNEIAACLDMLRETDLDVILLAGRYTLLEQDPLDELFPECQRRGTSLVIGGPYNSGILVTGVTRTDGVPLFNYAPASPEIVERVRRIESTAQRYGVPLPAAALQFPLAHPVVAAVIPGIDSPLRVQQAIEWYRTVIPSELWNDLRRQGLLRADAPLPVGGAA